MEHSHTINNALYPLPEGYERKGVLRQKTHKKLVEIDLTFFLK
jgi:hypothetical protein